MLVEYIPGKSLFHRLNPITKILWTFSVIIVCFMNSNPVFILAVFASNLAIAASGGIIKQMVPVIKGLLAFSLILVLCQIFLVKDGTTLFHVIPWFEMGPVTDMGLLLSLVMALRMLATVSTIPIFMMTTPMTDIVAVMIEKFRLPFKYVFMLTTALRFIPTFIDEMNQVLQAQMSRGYNSDTRNPFKKIFIIIPLAIPLLISSIKKSENLAISMEVRGFGSGRRSHYRNCSMTLADYIAIMIIAFIVLACITSALI